MTLSLPGREASRARCSSSSGCSSIWPQRAAAVLLVRQLRHRPAGRHLGGRDARLRLRAGDPALSRPAGRVRPDRELPALGARRVLERLRGALRDGLADRARARSARAARSCAASRADRPSCSCSRCTSRTAGAAGIALRRPRGGDRGRPPPAPARHHRAPAAALARARGLGRLDLADAHAPGRGPRRRGRDGHGLAAIAIGLVVAAALAMLVLDWPERSCRRPHALRSVYAGTLLFVARRVADRRLRPLRPATDAGAEGIRRVQTSSGAGHEPQRAPVQPLRNGRNEQFHTALQQVNDHPVLGGGPGTFDEYWFQHRRVARDVHDAHNLYLETLAELGSAGSLLRWRWACPCRAVAGTLVPARPIALAALRRLPRAREHRLGLGDARDHAHGPVRGSRAHGPRAERQPRRSGCSRGCAGPPWGDGGPDRLRAARPVGNMAVSASSKSTAAGRLGRAQSQARRAWTSRPGPPSRGASSARRR